MKWFTLCYSLPINVCYPVTGEKALSYYAAPHTAQIVSSSKKHQVSSADELYPSKGNIRYKSLFFPFMLHQRNNHLQLNTRASQLYCWAYWSWWQDKTSWWQDKPLPPQTVRKHRLREALQAVLPVFQWLCISLDWSGAIGVGWHLTSNTKGKTGISSVEKYANQIRAFNEGPGGHDQDRVCANTKTKHHSQVFVFLSIASALFSIKEYLGWHLSPCSLWFGKSDSDSVPLSWENSEIYSTLCNVLYYPLASTPQEQVQSRGQSAAIKLEQLGKVCL